MVNKWPLPLRSLESYAVLETFKWVYWFFYLRSLFLFFFTPHVETSSIYQHLQVGWGSRFFLCVQYIHSIDLINRRLLTLFHELSPLLFSKKQRFWNLLQAWIVNVCNEFPWLGFRRKRHMHHRAIWLRHKDSQQMVLALAKQSTLEDKYVCRPSLCKIGEITVICKYSSCSQAYRQNR